MALNKSMHPRNRYKDRPPDFSYLASKYPDFQQHVHTSLTGRPVVNFKEPEAVRALTCTLLKEDFGLTIEIPLERLIPTVPLRLNYIHWVEDLIDGQKQPRRGIDIGTGASCIYPLLGATMNGWYFLATEVDDICFDYATKNVEQNKMSDLIKVVKVPQKTLLMDALKEETEIIYDFCMCNPPFFANQLEAQGVNSRNSRRPPPSSVNTGGVTEIMAEGGELEFVKRIIHDSLQLKKRLRWYSCMLGKKCSLAPLKEELRKQGVPKVTHTEFCQGRTMRWALAWSFYDDVIVPSPPSKKRKLEKSRKPLSFTLPEAGLKELRVKALAMGCSAGSPVDNVTALLERTLTDLRVLHKRIPCREQEQSLVLTAVENNWIHGRQKRREQKRQLRELPRAPHWAAASSQTTAASAAHPKNPPSKNQPASKQNSSDTQGDVSHKETTSVQEETGNGCSSSKDETRNAAGEQSEVSNDVSSKDVDMESAGPKEMAPAANEPPTQRPPSPGAVKHFLFKCLLNVMLEGSDVLIEMHYVEGQNKDLLNQLCTYLKNSLLKSIARP
ncbi:RNA N6-adenosine-methyltransferase mettl16 [Hippoglossus hippoglossus]|uniref:RNA N6-adenosine-methyltransferase mettl16 n=1 Tax=Hippoglossus hippoglossus TaxID=8267 RepID=UPI00148E6EE8|nr:RNA N6-adenosine-methyltransferase mettl16 [Hippoglossus hippoglossus]XP_034459593.1 RNA N6-adenosine-methyltransferase mettl16 [Hippoglossus hippoglossus]XP_035011015.1 RNA N6-adenosine-methyltransferase mettl16 [Hippoglossus stenolepis]XP_035011016.1 RNA N6-adenosine-methyltransferase mettl16 [Hippoglossus stenolepis]XP_035011017.1 RNA N6-adenosine-methyltransferase mettl16 [Hippoglossus stenolepis]XP_035011018.1 RNA N6-adenosine-methyltransferase mettl16 [Hippoglossus stenolepis]